MPSIGQTLATARKEAGLSVEEAAHATRIHPNMIRYIEADDYSLFASVAYAKGFIRTYASHLGIDVSPGLAQIVPKLKADFGGEEWADEFKETLRRHEDVRTRLKRAARAFRHRIERPGSAPLLLNAVLVILIAALVAFYFIGFRAQNIDEAKAEFARSLRSANPFAEGDAEAEAEEASDAGELEEAEKPEEPEGSDTERRELDSPDLGAKTKSERDARSKVALASSQ
jgi:cytoskeletal protein RodZ